VTERVQPFSTFGGYGAGNLLGAVVTSQGPALVGSWEGQRSGLDAAVWLAAGDRWVRQSSAGTALESTAQLLVGPRAAAAAGPRIVLPGSAVRLGDGQVTQRAAVWQSTRLDSGWRRLDLPDPGKRSEAVSAGCTAGSCLLGGQVDGRYALWSVGPTTATRLAGVPQVTVDEKAAMAAPMAVGDQVLAIPPAVDRSVVLVGGDGSWTVSDGPDGVVGSSVVVGDWLYALSTPAGGSARLWRCPVSALR
jgi:hypothetical protein